MLTRAAPCATQRVSLLQGRSRAAALAVVAARRVRRVRRQGCHHRLFRAPQHRACRGVVWASAVNRSSSGSNSSGGGNDARDESGATVGEENGASSSGDSATRFEAEEDGDVSAAVRRQRRQQREAMQAENAVAFHEAAAAALAQNGTGDTSYANGDARPTDPSAEQAAIDGSGISSNESSNRKSQGSGHSKQPEEGQGEAQGPSVEELGMTPAPSTSLTTTTGPRRSLLARVFGRGNQNEAALKKYRRFAAEVLEYEPTLMAMSDKELQQQTQAFRERLAAGESLQAIQSEAFATMREASRRVLGMRHYDCQVIGGCVMCEGKIAEMRTGEGKTLVATLPVYLHALTGKGVHVVTVNQYLATRDSEWMGRVYTFLGLSVGLVKNDSSPEERRAAYASDLTYISNLELCFDYLRDGMASERDEIVLRVADPFHFAVIDEVDSVLIDEGRNPALISRPSSKGSERYYQAAAVAERLQLEADYTLDLKDKSVEMTEQGMYYAEQMLGVDLWEDVDPWGGYVLNALRAKEFYLLDKEYIVKDEQIQIVDEFTGRILPDRRWADGIHEAVQAKEAVEIDELHETVASITLQAFFSNFPKICGMTGTAKTEEAEFWDAYGLQVVEVPPNRPSQRQDLDTQIYGSQQAKWEGVVREVLVANKTSRPVLVGTSSVEDSERIQRFLQAFGVRSALLNAKPEMVEQEAKTIALAGRPGAVTIATNMAGRGTDILLGGNPKILAIELLKDELKKRFCSESPTQRSGVVNGWIDVSSTFGVQDSDGSGPAALDEIDAASELTVERVRGLLEYYIPYDLLVGDHSEGQADKPEITRTESAPHGKSKAVTQPFLAAEVQLQPVEIDMMLDDIVVEEEANILLRQQQLDQESDVDRSLAASDELAEEAGASGDVPPFDRKRAMVVELRKRAAKAYVALLASCSKQCRLDGRLVEEAGGLYVIGTTLHESRRIDNQLRGRAGRQGDKGSSRFIASLDDEIMLRFGLGGSAGGMTQQLLGDMPLETGALSKVLARMQENSEGFAFSVRKEQLKYDKTLEIQRKCLYTLRRDVVIGDWRKRRTILQTLIQDAVRDLVDKHTQAERPPRREEIVTILEKLAECAIVHNGPDFASPEYAPIKEVVRQLNEPGLMRLGARLQVDAIQQAIKSNDARRQIAEVTPLLTSSIWATVQAQLRTSDEASAAGRSGNDQDSNQSQTGSQSGQMQRRLEHRQRRALFEYLSESMLSLYEIRVAQVRKMHGMGTCDDAIAKAEGMIVINALDLEWQQYLQYTSNLKVLANVRSFGRSDPYDEFRIESAQMFLELLQRMRWAVLQRCFMYRLIGRNNSNKKATELLQEMYDERGEGDVDASNMNSLGGIQDKRQRGGGPDEPDVERIGSSGDDRDRPEPMWG